MAPVSYTHLAVYKRQIQDSHFYPVTELRHTVYQHNIHILNEGVMPYFIIVNVVLDLSLIHISDCGVRQSEAGSG